VAAQVADVLAVAARVADVQVALAEEAELGNPCICFGKRIFACLKDP